MATMSVSSAVSQSVSLPQRLLDFFARYPPKVYSAHHTGATIPLTRRKKSDFTASDSSSSSSSSSPPPSPPSIEPQTTSSPPTTTQPEDQLLPNPFLPWRNPETSRWRAPAYSLRRQADLVKLAKQHGVEPLLPIGRKATAFKEARILEKGLRVKGTGAGQKVKGHKWERKMPAKLEMRRQAMEKMPEMVRLWKQLGRGKGWKKFPK